MPNWCSGTIKIRGKYENVYKFLTEGVNMYVTRTVDNKRVCVPLPHEKWLEIYEDPEERTVNIYSYSKDPLYIDERVYIEETKRAYIDDFDILIDKEEDPVIAVASFSQAWGIRTEEFAKLAEKYEVDFRLYGVDSSMGFFEEYEILDNGKTIKDLSPKQPLLYSEFKWICPFPRMGG